jgi:hypothetical protein
MVSQEDQSDRIVNHLVKEQTIQLVIQIPKIANTQHQDLRFLIKMEDKYLHKQTNIILNLKFFYQLNNNKINSMEMLLKVNMEQVQLNNTVVLQHKLKFKLANLQVEVLELNSGDIC